MRPYTPVRSATVRYLVTRGKSYLYKRTVPRQFRTIVGKSAWWISLRATTLEEAQQEARRLCRAHDAELSNLKRQPPAALLRIEVGKLRQRLSDAEHAAQFPARLASAIERALPRLPPALRDQIGAEGGPSGLVHAIGDLSVDKAVTAQFPEGPSAYVLPDNVATLPADQLRGELSEFQEWQAIWRRARENDDRLRPVITELGLGDTAPLTITELADKWFSAVPREPNTVRRLRLVIRRFTETVGDIPAVQVTSRMLAEFIDQVADLPDPQARPLPDKPPFPAAMRNATMPELLEWRKQNPDHPRVLVSSRNTYRAGIRALFAWATRRTYIPADPSKDLEKLDDRRGRSEKRRPFTQAELVRIVETARSRWGETSERYLILLVSVYTGMRLAEPCGLRRIDLRRHSDAPDSWFFDIQHNPHRRVKTEESERLVPVHPDLIAAGLLKHADSVPSNGLLFPGIGRSGYLSQQFKDLIVGHAGIPFDAKVSWHSLRHTWADHAREVIPDAGRHAIMGHAEDGAAGEYGRGAGLRKLVEWTALLDPLGLRAA